VLSADAPARTQEIDVDRLFDRSKVHTVAIDVTPAELARLVPGSDERVRARLSFDGTMVDDIGLRLKSGTASLRPLEAKAGFSIDTDVFVRGRSLFGVTRFTLGNAVYDPSFIAESIAYDVFRRAGLYAPRTSLSEVTVNGDYFGLYVMREGYDKGFLRRTFTDPDGNLYEAAPLVDISDYASMEARTNESKADKSDLKALAAVVAGVPDHSYVAAIAEHVDLEQLLTYWAVEALVYNWDGYAVPSEWSPNNYYIYRDPARGKFVFLAHGADWALSDDPAVLVLQCRRGLPRTVARAHPRGDRALLGHSGADRRGGPPRRARTLHRAERQPGRDYPRAV
jgi:spore coat protein CotH